MTNSRSNKYYFLEILRGIAITLVVLRHASMDLQSRHNYYYLSGLITSEYGAVDLFFLMSGFVLMLNYLPFLGQSHRIVDYAKKRFIRIFPVYWICLGIVLGIYAIWKPALAELYSYDMPFYISNIFLIKGNWVIYPAWFIATQVSFYVMFLVAFFVKRLRIWMGILVIYLLLTIGINLLRINHSFPDYMTMVFNSYAVEFVSGILAALAYIRYQKNIHYQWVFWLGVMSFLITNIVFYVLRVDPVVLQVFRVISFSISFGLLCIGAVGLPYKPNLFNKVFYLLGQSSYSIYLLHMIVLQSLFIKSQRVMREYGNGMTFFLEATLIILTAIIIPVIFYMKVEKKLIKQLKHKLIHSTI